MGRARRQQNGLREKFAPRGEDLDRRTGLDVDHFFALENLDILQRVRDHDVDQRFAAHLTEPRIVFHHRRQCDLAAQGALFDHGRLEPAAYRVDAGRQSRRAAADDHHVGFHQFGRAFGNEDRLRLELFQGRDEHLLLLGAHPDQDIVGKRLGHAVRAILVGQVRPALDVHDLERDQLRFGDGGLQAVDDLLRTIGAGGADENFQMSLIVNAVDDFLRRLTQSAFAHADQQHGFQKGTALLAHRRPQPTDRIAIGIDQQSGRTVNPVLRGQRVIQSVLLEGDFGSQLPERTDNLAAGIRVHILVSWIGEQNQGNIVWQRGERLLQLMDESLFVGRLRGIRVSLFFRHHRSPSMVRS